MITLLSRNEYGQKVLVLLKILIRVLKNFIIKIFSYFKKKKSILELYYFIFYHFLKLLVQIDETIPQFLLKSGAAKKYTISCWSE